ncbi:MAG: hypothetical protein MI974_23675 [Chitinophagales bacterium]|nr:hypothetical protein [Chitinophagales bacterium]
MRKIEFEASSIPEMHISFFLKRLYGFVCPRISQMAQIGGLVKYEQLVDIKNKCRLDIEMDISFFFRR